MFQVVGLRFLSGGPPVLFGLDHIGFLVDTVTLELFSSGTVVANYDFIKTPYLVPSGAGVLGSLKAVVTFLRLIS